MNLSGLPDLYSNDNNESARELAIKLMASSLKSGLLWISQSYTLNSWGVLRWLKRTHNSHMHIDSWLDIPYTGILTAVVACKLRISIVNWTIMNTMLPSNDIQGVASRRAPMIPLLDQATNESTYDTSFGKPRSKGTLLESRVNKKFKLWLRPRKEVVHPEEPITITPFSPKYHRKVLKTPSLPIAIAPHAPPSVEISVTPKTSNETDTSILTAILPRVSIPSFEICFTPKNQWTPDSIHFPLLDHRTSSTARVPSLMLKPRLSERTVFLPRVDYVDEDISSLSLSPSSSMEDQVVPKEME